MEELASHPRRCVECFLKVARRVEQGVSFKYLELSGSFAESSFQLGSFRLSAATAPRLWLCFRLRRDLLGPSSIPGSKPDLGGLRGFSFV